MQSKIVAKLKTGAITNVVKYGRPLPAPPYIVVRADPDPVRPGIMFDIFVHMLPTQDWYLQDYTLNTLSTLLNGFAATDDDGNYNELLTEGEWSGILPQSDDGTISMKRRFFMPFILF